MVKKYMSGEQLIKIAFISASGGAGKTKLSLGLAWYLFRRKYRILLMDLDPTAGLSLLVLNENAYLRTIESNKTLSGLLADEQKGINKSLDEYTINISLGKRDEIISLPFNLLIPGEDLITQITQLFSGMYRNPGERFSKIITKRIPKGKWSFIIIDSAPFFDPRYIALSISLADWLIIPLRPTLIDFVRTYRMLKILEDDISTERILCLFNLVPTNPRIPERKLVENVKKGALYDYSSRDQRLSRRYETLREWYERLSSDFNLMVIPEFIDNAIDIDRFPTKGTESNFKAKTEKTYENLLDIILGK